MATGDQADCLARIQTLLPPWFGDTTQAPILNGVLVGAAWAMALVYSLWAYVALQTRIKTATDGFLDMIAGDWFGLWLQRRQGQTDVSYRALILSWILRERATHTALVKVLQDVTGRMPRVLEPLRALDTGSYDHATGSNPTANGYGAVGAWTTISLPRNTVLVVAYRPTVGSAQYGVQDADIYSAVEAVRPAGVVVWVQLQN